MEGKETEDEDDVGKGQRPRGNCQDEPRSQEVGGESRVVRVGRPDTGLSLEGVSVPEPSACLAMTRPASEPAVEAARLT